MNVGGPMMSIRTSYSSTSRAREAMRKHHWASDCLIVLRVWESQIHGEAGNNLRIVSRDTWAPLSGRMPLYSKID